MRWRVLALCRRVFLGAHAQGGRFRNALYQSKISTSSPRRSQLRSSSATLPLHDCHTGVAFKETGTVVNAVRPVADWRPSPFVGVRRCCSLSMAVNAGPHMRYCCCCCCCRVLPCCCASAAQLDSRESRDADKKT